MSDHSFKSIRQFYGELVHQCDKHASLLEQIHAFNIWGLARCLAYARLEDGCLHLLAKNSAAATRLRASADQVVLQLRQQGYAVQRVKVSAAPQQHPTLKDESEQEDRRPTLSADAHRAILALSEQSQEPKLARALKKLAGRYQGEQRE